MNFNFFNDQQLVLVEQESKFTLYDLITNGFDDPILNRFSEDTTNVSYIRVEDELRLVFTENAMYNFEGELITTFPRRIVDIFSSATGNFLIVAHANTGNHFRYILWNGFRILAEFITSTSTISENHFAVEQNGFWEIYSFFGNKIALDTRLPATKNLKLYRHFAIYVSVGNNKLISLDKGSLICEEQVSVKVSSSHNFAIFASLDRKVVTWYKGRYKKFDNVDNFTIVDDNNKLFALHQNGKYHLYQFNGHALSLDTKLDGGFDFVACNNASLMFINDGKPYFFEYHLANT